MSQTCQSDDVARGEEETAAAESERGELKCLLSFQAFSVETRGFLMQGGLLQRRRRDTTVSVRAELHFWCDTPPTHHHRISQQRVEGRYSGPGGGRGEPPPPSGSRAPL